MLDKMMKGAFDLARSKQASELAFWRKEILEYQDWYSGKLPQLYRTPSPTAAQKLPAPNLRDAAILTWHRMHQEAKYLEDLALAPEAFDGMKVLDVGSGPIPSATCFRGSDLYCLEPLLDRYLRAGFPLHYYGDTTFVHAASEAIPMQDDFFDAVISANAIDHVDDIRETAREIRRVLKPGGWLRMHVHYHPAAKCEPICYDDALFRELYGWAGEIEKVRTGPSSFALDVRDGEDYVLWSNFPGSAPPSAVSDGQADLQAASTRD